MVNQTTRYALIIVGHLVNRRDSWSPVKEIAEETGVPANYLSKILNRLAKEGVVDSLKGWGGGFRIRQEVLDRPIIEILRGLEGRGPGALHPCIFGFPECDDAAPCPLHEQWKRVCESYDRMMEGTPIAALQVSDRAAARRRRSRSSAASARRSGKRSTATKRSSGNAATTRKRRG